MITNALVERPWLSPVLLAILVAVGPVLGRRLADRPRWLRLLLGLSLVPVGALTLVPVDRDVLDHCTFQWSLPTPGRVELFANLVLFVAPVLFAGILTRRPLLMFLVGSGLSVVIEAIQALVPSIGRSCDTTDWLSSTLGAALGAVLALVTLALDRRATTQGPP